MVYLNVIVRIRLSKVHANLAFSMVSIALTQPRNALEIYVVKKNYLLLEVLNSNVNAKHVKIIQLTHVFGLNKRKSVMILLESVPDPIVVKIQV